MLLAGSRIPRANEVFAMSIFCRDKTRSIQGFLIKFLNNNCPDLKALVEGPRADSRVNLTVVVGVVPLEKGKIQPDRAFTAVTREFSSAGVGIVVPGAEKYEQAIICFRYEGEFYYALASAKHQTFLGGGFYQLGFQMKEMVKPNEYPHLADLSFQLFESA
jgi:hypothetical protein